MAEEQHRVLPVYYEHFQESKTLYGISLHSKVANQVSCVYPLPQYEQDNSIPLYSETNFSL